MVNEVTLKVTLKKPSGSSTGWLFYYIVTCNYNNNNNNNNRDIQNPVPQKTKLQVTWLQNPY